MLPWQTLELDTTVVVFEGAADNIVLQLRPENVELMGKIKRDGSAYRKSKEKKEFQLAVEKYFTNPKRPNKYQYEITAYVIKETCKKVTSLDSLPISNTGFTKKDLIYDAFEWRSYITGIIPESISYDCFLGAGYVRNGDLSEIIDVLYTYKHKDSIKLQDAVTKILANKHDLLVVTAGYVPKRLKINKW